MYEIIVIGGGPAGVTAALRARELGATVALIERDKLGGTCTNDGCVPTRVLARAARLAREAQQFSVYGLDSYVPRVNFGNLVARAQQVVYTIHEKKQLIKTLEEAGVDIFLGVGEAKFEDEHTIWLDGGKTLRAEKFIICVGGHARQLDFPGAEHSLTLNDVWSLKELPQHLAIIGAAATGCQLASIFAAFGVKVTLLDINDRILKLEDNSISAVINKAFVNRGIDCELNIETVERIDLNGASRRLIYKKDGQTSVLEVDAVVIAVGWPGNVDQLNLDAAGVISQKGYIPVDDYLRTSKEHIFAAGDITGRIGLVQRAGYDARIASENAILGIGQKSDLLIVPHGGFTDPEYGSVGMTEEQARDYTKIIVAEVPYLNLDRAVIDGHTEGCCKLIVSQENHRILGAHVVGEQALEVIHLIAAGMAADMWIEQLAELEIAYPTYTAIVGLAARKIIRDLGVVPVAPEWRALGKYLPFEWERREQL